MQGQIGSAWQISRICDELFGAIPLIQHVPE